MSKNNLIAIIFTLLSLNTVAQNKVKVDGVIAVIGKYIVLQSDIEKYKFEQQQLGEDIDISDCKILEKMMQQKMLAHHADVDSIIVTNSDVNPNVDRKITYFKQQLGGVDQMLALYGFSSEEDLREELVKIEKEQFLINQMRRKITKDVNVTPDEVRNYFNSLRTEDNLPDFPTEVRIAQIVKYVEPSKEEIDRVVSELNLLKKEIEDGANMKMKALINSDDPGVAQNGGLYKVTRESQFIKEFKDVAFSLSEGQVSEPFRSIFGYHIVKVEKIRGQELDVRHILIQPKVSDLQKLKVEQKLDSIKQQISLGKLSFEDAVKQFSEDEKTNKNKGLLINPFTQETTFTLSGEQFMQAFPGLHSKVYNLNQDDMTDIYYDEDREGLKMYKLLLLKEKIEGHTADFVKDYVKIQNLALLKKKTEVLEEWFNEKVVDTYIKISSDYQNCDFSTNFKK